MPGLDLHRGVCVGVDRIHQRREQIGVQIPTLMRRALYRDRQPRRVRQLADQYPQPPQRQPARPQIRQPHAYRLEVRLDRLRPRDEETGEAADSPALTPNAAK